MTTTDAPTTTRWADIRDRKNAEMTPAEREEYDATGYEIVAEEVLSRLVRELRTDAGLTQTELATLARTKQSTISAIETGFQVPTVPILIRLAEAAGKTLSISVEDK